jgi:aspartyl-tRNA(Asn)/glutamyl-tRNA(Gln) amidotransferase subunit C
MGMSTKITTEEVKRLAVLARLSIPESELETITQDITSILGFVDVIQSVQLDEQTTVLQGDHNIFRDDAVHPLVPDHDLIEAAPLHQDHFVKVPKVIE